MHKFERFFVVGTEIWNRIIAKVDKRSGSRRDYDYINHSGLTSQLRWCDQGLTHVLNPTTSLLGQLFSTKLGEFQLSGLVTRGKFFYTKTIVVKQKYNSEVIKI